MLFTLLAAGGVERIKESPQRVESARKLAGKIGCEVKAFFALLGEYDTMFLLQAPDDETVAPFSLTLGSLGNVRAQTLRAFTEEEYRTLVSRLP